MGQFALTAKLNKGDKFVDFEVTKIKIEAEP